MSESQNILPETSSLNEAVYKRIVDAITKNEFKPGQVLTELGLSKWLNVSRTPVREVVQRLKTEGLVTTFAGRGVIVTEVSTEDLMEICELRQLLEPHLYKKAAHNMSSDHRKELLECVAMMREAAQSGNRQQWLEYDKIYHSLIQEAANNKTIIQILNQRRPQVSRVMQNAGILPERLMQCTIEHEEVAKAVVSGDGDKAYESMKMHLISTTEHLMKVVYLKNK